MNVVSLINEEEITSICSKRSRRRERERKKVNVHKINVLAVRLQAEEVKVILEIS